MEFSSKLLQNAVYNHRWSPTNACSALGLYSNKSRICNKGLFLVFVIYVPVYLNKYVYVISNGAVAAAKLPVSSIVKNTYVLFLNIIWERGYQKVASVVISLNLLGTMTTYVCPLHFTEFCTACSKDSTTKGKKF